MESTMNERIKELAGQAGFNEYINENLWPEEQPEFNNLMEKFAELIVRECLDIVEQDMKLAHIQMIPLTLEKYANSRLKEKIREYFGVEE